VPESIRSGAAGDVLAAEEAHGTPCTLTLERFRQQYGKALCRPRFGLFLKSRMIGLLKKHFRVLVMVEGEADS
jgi:hypothetical protein